MRESKRQTLLILKVHKSSQPHQTKKGKETKKLGRAVDIQGSKYGLQGNAKIHSSGRA